MAYPDVWLRPAIKEKDCFKYWEYVLCYMDDVLCMSKNSMHTMKGIQPTFKLKDDNMEKPDVYLGADLYIMGNKKGGECWAMSSDKYCADIVKNVEETLAKKDLRLPTKWNLPTKHDYRPEMDFIGELKSDGLQLYQ